MFLRLLFFFSYTCATTGVSTSMGVDVNSYDSLCVGTLLLAHDACNGIVKVRLTFPRLYVPLQESLFVFFFFSPSLLSLPHVQSSELSGTILSLTPSLVSRFPLLLHDGSVYFKPFCHAFLLLCRRTNTIKNVGTEGCLVQVSVAFIHMQQHPLMVVTSLGSLTRELNFTLLVGYTVKCLLIIDGLDRRTRKKFQLKWNLISVTNVCLLMSPPKFVNVGKLGAMRHYGNSSPSCVVILYINNLRIDNSENP